MELIGAIKDYEWGKLGTDSLVARLAAANRSDCSTFQIEPDKPYAELWMGDHCSGPALVKETGEELGTVVRPHEKLSYLLKVLSIRKALSIQVHPNKTQGAELHKKFPDIYKDPNHKPEMAIALTEFQALCGFRPCAEIDSHLKQWPELQALLGTDRVDELRNVFSQLMRSEPEQLEKCISQIHSSLLAKEEKSALDELFLQLHRDFGCDVGLLCIYFLNVINLQPGQAFSISAGVPHAYIRGDCVECMACSDNVIRAGLTPKFKDVETLLKVLDWRSWMPESLLCAPKLLDPNLQPYTSTFFPNNGKTSEFAVSMLKVPAKVSRYPIINGPANGCILLVCSGGGKLQGKGPKGSTIQLKVGSIVFLPSDLGIELEFINNTETGQEFVAYLAMSGY